MVEVSTRVSTQETSFYQYSMCVAYSHKAGELIVQLLVVVNWSTNWTNSLE